MEIRRKIRDKDKEIRVIEEEKKPPKKVHKD